MMGKFGGLFGGVVVSVLLVGIPLGNTTGLLQGNIPGNVNNNQNQQGNRNGVGGAGGLFGGALNRQGGGLSFIIPGLSLLQGNQNNNNNNGGIGGGGGNLFGTVTVTRTLVSTVSTVTTVSFRTCTTSVAGLMACNAGRRRRDAEDPSSPEDIQIQPTPAIQLSIGATTITDREAVIEYLEAHKPSSQSIIYPPDYQQVPNDKLKINPRFEQEVTTILYPSQDTPEENDDLQVGTTETAEFFDETSDATTSSPENDDISDDKARRGLARTTTVTTVIRVTSVATTLATGTSATLTVSYAGCLPQSLPVSGMPCSGT